MTDPRKALKQNINDVLGKIQELEYTVSDFDGNQELLDERIANLIASLQRLHQQSAAIDYRLPSELLTYLDKGSNPDTYTAEVFARANRANQYSKGKVEALQGFRDALKQEVAKEHPKEAAAYANMSENMG